jgi:Lar family restriction alleviation protein
MNDSNHVVAMETVSEDMLPCPFCGGEVEVREMMSDMGRQWFDVGCRHCEASGPAFEFDPEADEEREMTAQAIAAWNRRAPSELLASRLAKQAPAGWVLAPHEATPAMIDAGNAHMAQVDLGLPFDLWRIMLAASPSPVLGEPK